MIEPKIGMKSISQISRDITIAYSGAINARAASETIKIMQLTRNCAFKKPKITLFKRANIKRTFSAVESFSRLKSMTFKSGKSNMNKKSAIRKTIKLTRKEGMPVSRFEMVS